MDYLMHFAGLLFIPFIILQLSSGFGDIRRGLSPILSRQLAKARNFSVIARAGRRAPFALEG